MTARTTAEQREEALAIAEGRLRCGTCGGEREVCYDPAHGEDDDHECDPETCEDCEGSGEPIVETRKILLSLLADLREKDEAAKTEAARADLAERSCVSLGEAATSIGAEWRETSAALSAAIARAEKAEKVVEGVRDLRDAVWEHVKHEGAGEYRQAMREVAGQLSALLGEEKPR